MSVPDEASKRTGTPPASIAIAWVMSRPAITSPIASASNVAQVKEIVDASRLTLDEQTLKLLDHASEEAPVSPV